MPLFFSTLVCNLFTLWRRHERAGVNVQMKLCIRMEISVCCQMEAGCFCSVLLIECSYSSLKKKGLCKFKKQIFGLFFFVEVLYCLQRDKVSQAHAALKALVKCPLPNSSPKFFLANTTDWMLRWWDLDGKWLFISVQINIPLVYSATIFV